MAPLILLKAATDQPHMGFNNQWIVVNSLCTVADNGYSLQVFDKQNLFGGGTLNLGTNWFEFQDQVTNDDGRLDNPVATYVSDAVERLTHGHVKKNGEYQVVYSHITGATDSPVYTPDTASTTIANFTGLSNNLAPAQAPSCTTDCSIQPSCCISSLVSGWVHSSGVYSDLNGNEVLVSANVSGWTAHSNTNVAEYVVENLSTNNSYASIVGSAGTEYWAPRSPRQLQGRFRLITYIRFGHRALPTSIPDSSTISGTTTKTPWTAPVLFRESMSRLREALKPTAGSTS